MKNLEDFRFPTKINENQKISLDLKINENQVYSYSKIISDDDWRLLEIIPNKIEHKNPTEIIKICENEAKTKNPKLIDANSQIRKNVLKGFGSK